MVMVECMVVMLNAITVLYCTIYCYVDFCCIDYSRADVWRNTEDDSSVDHSLSTIMCFNTNTCDDDVRDAIVSVTVSYSQ